MRSSENGEYSTSFRLDGMLNGRFSSDYVLVWRKLAQNYRLRWFSHRLRSAPVRLYFNS